MNRPTYVLPVLAVALLVGVGCSGSSSDDDPTAGEATAVVDETADLREQGVKFADCIRSHGVHDFPDPEPSGEFIFGINVSPAVWQAAVDACKDLQPPGSLSVDRTPEQQSAGLRFAQCMRDNGVADFPDPVEGEPLVNTERIPSSNRSGGMAILNGAMEQCRDLLSEAASGQ